MIPMRRSSCVTLTILASVGLLPGCRGGYESRNCVDGQGRIVPSSNCQAPGSGGTGYHYIYGGASGGRIGDRVVGGRSTPSESGITRGGFGHGGGEGGGE